ncbi:MAG TPA: hypothetical protein PKY50_17375 [Candidatus Competibacter sp.]|nr:hypothetical protein [Candidatus Competibacter sp.]
MAPDDPNWVRRTLNEVDAWLSANPLWSKRIPMPTRSFDLKQFFLDWLIPLGLPDHHIPYHAIDDT